MNPLTRILSALLPAVLGAAAAAHFFPAHGAAFASALAATGVIAGFALLLGPSFPIPRNSPEERSNDRNAPPPGWLAPLLGFFVACALSGALLAAGRLLAQWTDDYAAAQVRLLWAATGAGLAGALASRLRIGTSAGRLAAALWMLAGAVLVCGPLLGRAGAFAALVPAFFAGLALASAAGHPLPTAAGAAAGLFAGVWMTAALLFPRLHYAGSLYAAVAWPLVGFALVVVVGRLKLWRLAAGVAVLALIAAALPGRLAPIHSPGEGWTVTAQREGLAGAVTLLEKQVQPGQPMLQRLIVDNRHVLGGELGFGEKRLGHVPLLLKPDAKRALFVGVGAGVVMGAAKSYTGLEQIDACEPSPDIVALIPQFAAVNDQLAEEPRVKIMVGAPAALLARSPGRYDVIVSGPMPPDREGAAWLLTRGFFADAKRHLTPGGVFAQWLPLRRMGAEDLRLVVRTYLAEFPEARGFIGIYNGELPVFGLLARAEGPVPPAEEISRLLGQNGRAHAFISDMADLLGSELLDAAGLRAFAGAGPLHEGRFPALLAGRSSRGTPSGNELLSVLLSGATPVKPGWPAAGVEVTGEALDRRVKAVRAYLAGDALRAGGDVSQERGMIDHFLAAYRVEPEFPPAKSMLLLQSLQRPHLARSTFEAMLERTPEDDQLRKLFLQVQRRNAEQRGLPMPPSAGNAPGLPPLPGMPAPPAPKPPSPVGR